LWPKKFPSKNRYYYFITHKKLFLRQSHLKEIWPKLKQSLLKENKTINYIKFHCLWDIKDLMINASCALGIFAQNLTWLITFDPINSRVKHFLQFTSASIGNIFAVFFLLAISVAISWISLVFLYSIAKYFASLWHNFSKRK